LELGRAWRPNHGCAKITSTSHFANDLGLDSLDTVEVVMAVEEVSVNPFLSRQNQ
jgi:acyl carrier protein